MQVQIKLDDDQVDEVLVEGLKKAYEINLTFPHEPNYDELNDAFKVLLKYFMGDKNGAKYLHGLAKVEKKYNAQRLAEANGGL
jgi:hypothetical protein